MNERIFMFKIKKPILMQGKNPTSSYLHKQESIY